MKNLRMLLLIIVLGITVFLSAHPADDIKLNFDLAEKILTVTIYHSVKDAEKHFIEIITVKINKKEIITQKLEKQNNLKETTAIYKIIDAKAGDKIIVVTKCNKFGKKTEKLIVQAKKMKKNE